MNKLQISLFSPLQLSTFCPLTCYLTLPFHEPFNIHNQNLEFSHFVDGYDPTINRYANIAQSVLESYIILGSASTLMAANSFFFHATTSKYNKSTNCFCVLFIIILVELYV